MGFLKKINDKIVEDDNREFVQRCLIGALFLLKDKRIVKVLSKNEFSLNVVDVTTDTRSVEVLKPFEITKVDVDCVVHEKSRKCLGCGGYRYERGRLSTWETSASDFVPYEVRYGISEKRDVYAYRCIGCNELALVID